MFDIGRLKDGDTVLISGAAGSVGLVRLSLSPFLPCSLSLLLTIPPLPLTTQTPLLLPPTIPITILKTQIACQIALAHPKCKVIALASSSKIKQLEKLGCHAVLDYTKEGFKKELRKHGLIDVYFDNGMFLPFPFCSSSPPLSLPVPGSAKTYNILVHCRSRSV